MGGLGILSALQRRATYGGSYLVQVSLLQSANYLQSLGKQPDALVENLWKNYRADSTDLNPEADLVGVMGYFAGFQSTYLREGFPRAYADNLFMQYDNTGFGGSPRQVVLGLFQI